MAESHDANPVDPGTKARESCTPLEGPIDSAAESSGRSAAHYQIRLRYHFTYALAFQDYQCAHGCRAVNSHLSPGEADDRLDKPDVVQGCRNLLVHIALTKAC